MSRADEIRLMTKVARMYYDQGIRQQEITERLNIHQSTISRLLKRARESNIVRISVAIPLGTFSEMEEALASRFSLREAIVVDSSEDEERLVRDLGAAAAFLVETSVKERDTESGNDYFGARYYASSMARFISPDSSEGPDPVPFGDLGDPQSLNLYTYLTNNPLSNVDDDGHDGAAPAATCGGGIGGLVCRLRQALRGGGAGGGSNPPSPPPPSPPGVPEGAPGTPTGPLMQAQQNARSNPRFQPIPGGATFCNMASCYIGQHVPGTNMSPLMTNGVPNLANTDANTLAHSGNYHQIGRAEAQRIANTGKVVYGVYKEPGHGHIVTVAPDNTYFGQAYFPNHNPNDPLINDIGRHIGVYPLSQQPSSGFRNEVIFYAPN